MKTRGAYQGWDVLLLFGSRLTFGELRGSPVLQILEDSYALESESGVDWDGRVDQRESFQSVRPLWRSL